MLWREWLSAEDQLKTGRYACILAGMRTGSNLLQSYLNQCPGIVCLGELFNPVFVGVDRPDMEEGGFGGYRRDDVQARDRDRIAFFNRLLAEAGNRELVFRLFDGHGAWAWRRVMRNRQARKVVLTRDPLEAYVSLELARATRQWVLLDSADRKVTQIEFNPVDYLAFAQERATYYSNICGRLEASGQAFVRIDYAELDDLEAVNRVIDFICPGQALSALPDTLVRQNPGTLAAKIANYDEVAGFLEARSTRTIRPF
ncbi:hypothetical protein E4634_13175 [Mangrovimicrobium sediminis]|uniref:Sulfotransferase n=1 Tax=Mangrovimicrobium sediminis TaxID=2562682 RepID=A0A4Z0LZ28_9GAMM|nr:hypothetical protein [Haliea sp. SAOS-164]TGD72480.1 hypothetical protein E4634_13175 [Haliea sp. SAOS-164]